MHQHGPYHLGENREMLVRDFVDLAECDLPWLDGVAENVPYTNLTMPMATEGVHFNIIDDWGSFAAEPEFQGEHIRGVGPVCVRPAFGRLRAGGDGQQGGTDPHL